MSSVNNRTPVVLNFDDSAGDPDDAYVLTSPHARSNSLWL